jgi:hypothetical protein
VAEDMEMLTIHGSYVFDQSECLTQGQIKSYFSRLTLKQRSQQQVSSQQQIKSTPSTQTEPLKTSIGNSLSSATTTTMDESEDDEAEDDRDLDVYAWRQMVDQARSTIATTSASVGKATASSMELKSRSASTRNIRTKRKSTDDEF